MLGVGLARMAKHAFSDHAAYGTVGRYVTTFPLPPTLAHRVEPEIHLLPSWLGYLLAFAIHSCLFR